MTAPRLTAAQRAMLEQIDRGEYLTGATRTRNALRTLGLWAFNGGAVRILTPAGRAALAEGRREKR